MFIAYGNHCTIDRLQYQTEGRIPFSQADATLMRFTRVWAETNLAEGTPGRIISVGMLGCPARCV